MSKIQKLGLYARPLGTVLNRCAQADAKENNRYIILLARLLPAAVLCHRYMFVVPKPLPVALFLVRRRYLIMVPSHCPRRRSLCVAGT
jgi:hypothetical protein